MPWRRPITEYPAIGPLRVAALLLVLAAILWLLQVTVGKPFAEWLLDVRPPPQLIPAYTDAFRSLNTSWTHFQFLLASSLFMVAPLVWSGRWELSWLPGGLALVALAPLLEIFLNGGSFLSNGVVQPPLGSEYAIGLPDLWPNLESRHAAARFALGLWSSVPFAVLAAVLARRSVSPRLGRILGSSLWILMVLYLASLVRLASAEADLTRQAWGEAPPWGVDRVQQVMIYSGAALAAVGFAWIGVVQWRAAGKRPTATGEEP